MNHLKPSPRHVANHAIYRSRSAHAVSPARRGPSIASDIAIGDGLGASDVEGDVTVEDDPIHIMLKERWARSEDKIAALFGGNGSSDTEDLDTSLEGVAVANCSKTDTARPTPFAKKPARVIDEDDYGDDEEEEEPSLVEQSPLQSKSKTAQTNGILPPPARSPLLPPLSLTATRTSTSSTGEQSKSLEDVRKKLEEDKRTAEEGAKRSFHTMFFTLESDRDAMLEQQKLDELDRQVENELSDGTQGASGQGQDNLPTQGSLSTADLGASSLTLKNLIARIDAKRNLVNANDTQLRTLISEVRKGRSKWASEERVGQEELYEAAEKVLMELKAMTEYSAPFLQRVNKRDAPDYFHIIKHPMDIGSMIKKLKGLQYKSKKDFVGDLSLIWSNCLTYNANVDHPLRKKALYMRKETDKLVPLIPDIVVRDRAEVEAEERRLQNLDPDADGGEDSDDDQPIMASRGRKAPSKGKKGPTNNARQASTVDGDETPAPENKPAMHASTSSLRNEFLRAESDIPLDASSNGFSTPPPPGTQTPLGANGHLTSGVPGSQADVMEVDSTGNSVVPNTTEEVDDDDTEFKTWKQVTKKDRAVAAADRNRLFRGDHLNPEEPALLRNKAGMRRWLRQQKQYMSEKEAADLKAELEQSNQESHSTGETLAEGIEKDQDRTLPDYYDTLTAIPNLDNRIKWIEDSEGKVVPQTEESLRLFPEKQFTYPESILTKRMVSNMQQMQDTRKVCAKIGIVKQMQIQAQTYQNQFQKYDPLPFVEQDIGPVAVSEDGPIMDRTVNRAAFQRSVGEIFYHAGFEDFQPSALEAMTDVATDFFTKLVKSLDVYADPPKNEPSLMTAEEKILHCLQEHGLDLESLETYVREDVERLGTKLVVVHDRMRSHLADLLRPALADNAGADGVGAFNDGSEQFVGGDFAEDIDEDFFGFKELGLADEFGLESLSVPLHLLQNRMHSAFAASSTSAIATTGTAFEPPPAYEPVTTENLNNQIDLVRDFFASKLAANNGRPLIEDEDLPPKQRFPKPRLGPTGKISSPRKRPLREQQQAAKKKRKMEEAGIEGTGDGGGGRNKMAKGISTLRLEMPDKSIENGIGDPEKDAGDGGKNARDGAMLSPESLTAS